MASVVDFYFFLGCCFLLINGLEGKTDYDCHVCVLTVGHAIDHEHRSFTNACASILNQDICSDFVTSFSDFNIDSSTAESEVRNVCIEHNACTDVSEEAWRSLESTSSIDVRIAKGYGTRGYDKIRVSVISSESLSLSNDIFTYSQPFRYRWTDKFLTSGIMTIVPGEKNVLNIAGEDFEIFIPKEGEGIRGVLIADPCFSSEFVWCTYGEKLDIFNRSTALLNAINAHNDNNFWMVLGDNFYDQSGEPSSVWFSALSKQTKAKVFGAVPGNHDFWIFRY